VGLRLSGCEVTDDGGQQTIRAFAPTSRTSRLLEVMPCAALNGSALKSFQTPLAGYPRAPSGYLCAQKAVLRAYEAAMTSRTVPRYEDCQQRNFIADDQNNTVIRSLKKDSFQKSSFCCIGVAQCARPKRASPSSARPETHTADRHQPNHSEHR